MTKFAITDKTRNKGYSLAYGYPNDAHDPSDPDSPKEITVVFGPKADQGEVETADIPDKYAKGLLKRALEKEPYVVVVPPKK